MRRKPDGTVTVGPDSVGYEITSKALVFGGDTLTATDIAVRLGMYRLGDPAKVAGVPLELAQKAMTVIRGMAEDAIDSMKVSSADIDVILVGGGSIILPEDLAGAAAVVKPDHFGCANAIGSAIPKSAARLSSSSTTMKSPGTKRWNRRKPTPSTQRSRRARSGRPWRSWKWRTWPLAYYAGHTNRVKVKAPETWRTEAVFSPDTIQEKPLEGRGWVCQRRSLSTAKLSRGFF